MKPLGKRHCCMSYVCFFLLFLLAQMLYVLVLLHGLFISSTKALISPFNVCHRGQDGLFCSDHNYDVGDASKLNTNIARVTVILGLYTPLALVPFALLAFLFAVCCEEGGLLWVSLVCQTASSLLTLLGLSVFTTLHWAYVSMDSLTAGFYVCVGVCVELAIAAWLTWMSGRKKGMTEKNYNL